jgi:hypothetical protein
LSRLAPLRLAQVPPGRRDIKKLPKQAVPCHNLRLVNEPAFDPSSQRVGEASRWSRRDFVKLSFAASGAIVATSFVGSSPKSYRVAAVGADPYAGKVLDSIRRIRNTEIVNLAEKYAQPDLIVIGVSDLSDTRLADLAANSASSVLIVSHVCQPIRSLAELAPARLRKGRFVHASGQRRLVPELISLSEMVQDRFCAANRLPISAQTEPARNKQRIFSGWALWIDPAA